MAKGKFVQQLIEMAEKAGLDMSDAARMQRARDMGFDTDQVYYHGTSADFDEFDPSRGGANYGVDDDKGLVFFSNLKDEAEYSANEAASNIGGEPKIIEAFLKFKNPMIVDTKGKNPTNYLDGKKEHLKYDLEFKTNEDGDPYDGIIVKNFETGESVAVTALPENIRKTSAAFDPSKKDSGNLLAGAIPASLGIGAMLGGTEQAQAMPAPDLSANSYIQNAGQSAGSIQAPINETAALLAALAGNYNQARKERLNPIADMLMPVGELPEELWRKRAYGDEVSSRDYINAILGMF
jgi:hypothetical protein